MTPGPLALEALPQPVSRSTAARLTAGCRRWLAWDLVVVDESIPTDALPLSRGPKKLEVPELEAAEHVFSALCALRQDADSPRFAELGVPWWARPLAAYGDANQVAVVAGRPVVLVIRDAVVVGLIAPTRTRAGDDIHWPPSHDIHGRPWRRS